MNWARTLLSVLFTVNLVIAMFSTVALVGVSGDHSDENWTDGPGDIEDANRNGIDKSTYATLWSLDEDEDTTSEPRYDISEDEAQDDDLSWKETVNMAEQVDFSYREHPGQIEKWNDGSKNSFQNSMDGNSDSSWVPDSAEDNLENTEYVKDAYIDLYSVDPSTHVYDADSQNDYVYAKPKGDVVAVIDYRLGNPTASSFHKKVELTHKNTKIKYHQLSTEPNCDSGDCRLGKDTKNQHVRTLEYGGYGNQLDTGVHELYLEGKITTTWERKEYACVEPDYTPPEDDDDDSSSDDSTDGDSDDSTDDGDDTSTGGEDDDGGDWNGPGWGLNVEDETRFYSGASGASGWGSDVQYDHSDNEDQDGECDDWASTPDVTTIERDVIVDNSFEMYVQNSPSAEVQYAKISENKYQVYIKTDSIWTHTELPGNTMVSSGWQIFSSRSPAYAHLNEYTASGTSEFVPRNPPLRANVFPSSHGVETYSDSSADNSLPAPTVVYTDGVERDAPEMPSTLSLSTRQAYTDGERNQFTDPREVVLEYNDFKPSQQATVHGVLRGSTTTEGSSVREVEKASLQANIKSLEDSSDKMEVSVTLTDSNGNPISTQDREGYITLKGEQFNTNSEGKATVEMTMPPISGGYNVQYVAQPWWETPDDMTAYQSTSAFVRPPDPFDLWDLSYWFFKWGLVFGSLYFVTRRTLLNLIGVDIRVPFAAAWSTLKSYFQWPGGGGRR